ncbi:UNVERIFIED_CONTAM: Carbon catabolite repressor protein 45 [Sesamum radiatum]|uniref:Carbon catabolite repressor protein 45 n=1 Tax=Sesamum radiatum TaxID=300843 RepID=A0AAW2PL01_SESRA
MAQSRFHQNEPKQTNAKCSAYVHLKSSFSTPAVTSPLPVGISWLEIYMSSITLNVEISNWASCMSSPFGDPVNIIWTFFGLVYQVDKMRIFLEKAYELSQEWGRIPVVITGDLNSLPQLHIQQHDRRQVSGQIFPSEYAESQSRHNRITRPLMNRWTDEEIMLATGSRLSVLRHHLKLCSAYAGVPGTPDVRDKIGEPLTTSYHCLFTGTVDYIWHTADLVPVRVLETLPIRSLKKTGGLPCKKWGSDHLAVACELAFADEGD